MNEGPNSRATDKVILPINGRPKGPPAESVFSNERREDISLVGEVFRKLTHLGAISIPVGYYFIDRQALLYLSAALLLSFVVDFIRFFGGEKSKNFIYRYGGIMIRPHEKRSFTGATYILSGSIITIILFDKPIAIAAIAFIVLGDIAGAIIGRLWGMVRFRGKSLEGSVGFFLACSIVAIVVPGIALWVKIAGALVATVTEALTLHIDDNLIVPITSGALMQLIFSQMIILEHFS